jgi:hypothetical protein
MSQQDNPKLEICYIHKVAIVNGYCPVCKVSYGKSSQQNNNAEHSQSVSQR